MLYKVYLFGHEDRPALGLTIPPSCFFHADGATQGVPANLNLHEVAWTLQEPKVARELPESVKVKS
jgi:hypothetical protein